MTYRLIDGAEVWKLHATYGFPLEMSLPILADRSYIPTWDSLLLAADKDGADLPRLCRRLHDAVGDAYPAETALHIREGLDRL